jgi:hypothetical protein
MVLRINFLRLFFYSLLATLLSVSGLGPFTQPLTFCLIFAIIFLIEGEIKSEYELDYEDEDES